MIKAIRAFDRAMAMASPWLAERKEIDESVSNPMAMTVNRIIRLRVTMSANPRSLDRWCILVRVRARSPRRLTFIVKWVFTNWVQVDLNHSWIRLRRKGLEFILLKEIEVTVAIPAQSTWPRSDVEMDFKGTSIVISNMNLPQFQFISMNVKLPLHGWAYKKKLTVLFNGLGGLNLMTVQSQPILNGLFGCWSGGRPCRLRSNLF